MATENDYKAQHFLRRLAAQAVHYEDELANAAIREQILVQQVQQLQTEVENLKASKEEPEPEPAPEG